MGLRVGDGRVTGVEPLANHPISRGQLCTKGWASAFAIDPVDRITTPLIRAESGFRQAGWDEVLDLIVGRIEPMIAAHGPDACGVISSARATNEDNYAAQKFARAVLGTHNVDHCARICHSPSVAGLTLTLGSGAMTNSIEDVSRADLLVVWGADTTENHAILGSRMLRAHLTGTKLLVVDPRRTRLARMADLHLQLRLGSNIALANGLLHILFKQGWANREFLDARCEGEVALRQALSDYTPERVAQLAGIPTGQLEAAARLLAGARAAFFAYGMGITQYASGTDNVIALSNLVLCLGQIGRAGTGINPLRGQNNVQGACDMGALPNVFPGYQDALDPAVRARFAQAWCCDIPDTPGLTSLGMSRRALEGKLRCLIVLGEDPVVTDPDQNFERSALEALDLLVVCELVMTETARLAHVVLPAASFAEKDGTFTNCERRVQRVRRAVPPPGEARADWEILAALAERLGHNDLRWNDAETIFDEMAALTPTYSAMTYPRLEAHDGLQWPCDADHPDGTPCLHTASFTRGKGLLMPVHHQGPAEMPDEEYPLFLTTQRLHFHYGCGSMTRKSPLLERETLDGRLYLHPDDAAALGVVDRTPVRVCSRRGMVETRAILTLNLPPGTVSMPYHFRECPSNQLTHNVQDPISKMPELKACAVRVEALPQGVQPRDINRIRAEKGL
jgi:formate dehydrogenase major subunit